MDCQTVEQSQEGKLSRMIRSSCTGCAGRQNIGDSHAEGLIGTMNCDENHGRSRDLQEGREEKFFSENRQLMVLTFGCGYI
jgi:hypothetical protein